MPLSRGATVWAPAVIVTGAANALRGCQVPDQRPSRRLVSESDGSPLENVATTDPENEASRHLLVKAGFTLLNQTMRDHLGAIAQEARALVDKSVAAALDIGCNDGTLLRCYPETIRRIGIDPSDIAGEVKGNLEIVRGFFPSAELSKRLKEDRCEIVTSIAMFYDLEDPMRFVRGIKSLLHPDGVWIFEMSYMPAMLEMNSYDTICHEHLEYYTLKQIRRILAIPLPVLWRDWISLLSIYWIAIWRVFSTSEEANLFPGSSSPD